MRPIRKEEMEYLKEDISSNFGGQKDIVKSNMVNEIDEISEKNQEKFINKLNVKKKMKAVKEAYDIYHKFVNDKEVTEHRLKNKLDKSIQDLEVQFSQWNKVRKWEDYDSNELRNPSQHQTFFNKLCRQETERAYYASPKGKALKLLEIQEKRANHILHSGQSIQSVWTNLGKIYKGCKIDALIPTEMLQIENK